MPAYRFYLLNGHGHIVHRVDLDCSTDDEAIAAVEGHRRSGAMELWDGARVVRRFPPNVERGPGGSAES